MYESIFTNTMKQKMLSKIGIRQGFYKRAVFVLGKKYDF